MQANYNLLIYKTIIIQVKYEEIAQNYQNKRQCMSSKSTVSVAHLLAAREGLIFA